MHGGIRTEEKNGGTGRTKSTAHRQNQAEVLQKGNVAPGFGLVAGLALMEKSPIPLLAFAIEAGIHLQRINDVILETLGCRVAEERFDFVAVATLGRATLAHIGFVYPPIQIYGLVRTMNFRNIKD